MGKFIISPNIPRYGSVWDNPFLWREENVYIMANHRLALWCWLQQREILRKEYSLIHIDKHTDARKWASEDEQKCLKKILSEFETLLNFSTYENFHCSCKFITDRNTRPCITYDNFIHLAAEARLFKHYYLYCSIGDWDTSLPTSSFNHYKKIEEINNIEEIIIKCAGACILDLDLDFFDDEDDSFPKSVTGEGLLKEVMEKITKHRDKISMITVSINEMPGSDLWDRRQSQLSLINQVLALDIPLPIPFDK